MNRKATWIAAGAGVLVFAALLAFMLAPNDNSAGRPPSGAGTRAGDTAPAGSQAEKRAREEIRQVQARFTKAVREQDLKTVLSLMTDDFEMKPLQGPVLNKKQSENAMKQAWPRVRSIDRWDLNLVDFRLEGSDKAVGVVKERLVANLADSEGQVQKQDTTTQSRNTWVRTPSGWKYRRMVDMEPRLGALDEPEYVTQEQWVKNTRETKAANQAAARADKDARPPTPAEARALLEKIYGDFRAAVKSKDADAALATLTDDYRVDYPTHYQTRQAVEASVKRDFRSTVSIPEWTQKISDIKVNGNVITVTVNERKTTVMKVGGGQKRGTLIVKMRDTWRKEGGKWKNSRTELLSVTTIVDGKQTKAL